MRAARDLGLPIGWQRVFKQGGPRKDSIGAQICTQHMAESGRSMAAADFTAQAGDIAIFSARQPETVLQIIPAQHRQSTLPPRDHAAFEVHQWREGRRVSAGQDRRQNARLCHAAHSGGRIGGSQQLAHFRADAFARQAGQPFKMRSAGGQTIGVNPLIRVTVPGMKPKEA